MTARAKLGWRDGTEAAVAVLMVAVLLWAGGMLDTRELSTWPARLAVVVDPGPPRVVRVLSNETGVLSLAWSPDGERIAGGGILHRFVSVWDVGSGARVLRLDSQAGGVTSVAWSSDGKYLATGRNFVRLLGQSVSIWLWDANTGALIRGIPAPFPLRAADNDVRTLAWSPDGRRLAAGYGSGAIVIHDPGTGASLITVPGQIPVGRRFGYSPDGRSIVSTGYLVGIPPAVYDAGTGREVKRLSGQVYMPDRVAWSPDGALIASADLRHPEITVWDPPTGRRLRTLVWQGPPARDLAFTPDGRGLVSTAPGIGVHVWDATSGRLLHALSTPRNSTDAVGVSPDGCHVAAADRASVVLWALPPCSNPPDVP